MKKQLADYSIDTIGQNTYQALKHLIDNSLYAQTLHPMSMYASQDIFELGYLKEYCTVRMSTARQSGHTTAMCKVAYEYFDKVAILGYNYNMAGRYGLYFKDLIANSGNIIKYTISEITTSNGYYMFGSQQSLDKFREYEFEAVFVDVSCMLKKKEEGEIYRAFGPCMSKYPQKLFVFIQ